MKIRARRRVTKLGPLHVNRTGLRVTSVTVALSPWHRLELWSRAR